ncbi:MULTISPECIES: response regulator transcription factor [Geodermatophilus]|uniref:Response regulator transcription factor n=1 Tax=Geodermatophilus arenarius TaxID=1137990 RepID=A0ABV9LKT6_9ACTN
MAAQPDDAGPARVFLVDDHKVVRTGLAAYLATEPGMTVVGEADDGRRALDALAVLEGAGERTTGSTGTRPPPTATPPTPSWPPGGPRAPWRER